MNYLPPRKMSHETTKAKDVTEAIVRAMDKAAEVEATHVFIIFYSCKKETQDYRMDYISNDVVTIETANWMIDKAKRFLLRDED